jgi:dTDP-4-dehydrorhamnose reductase
MGKRVAVFGCAGQLGVELCRVFEERGYEVRGFDRSQVDITDAARVESTLGEADPGIVVNAAAYNQVDVAEHEPHAAFQGNALAVRNLALACRQLDAKLVHFSTDYVFDGFTSRPYTEDDPVHPLGAYAVSKLGGELYAQAYLSNPLIIRTSGVFGPGGLRTARGNFVELMLRRAEAKLPIRVVEDHVASPSYAPELAVRTLELLQRGATGIFHVGGGTAISWYDYARLIFDTFEMKPEVQGTNEREYRTPARRPKYSALSNAKMESLGITPMPPLHEALEMYRAKREQMLQRASDGAA